MKGYYWNCNNHNLKIANRQTSGDRVRNYTCFNRGGASLFDYLIVEHPIPPKIENLKILPFEFDSKFTSISITFRIEIINNTIGKLLYPPRTYKGDSQGFTIFSFLINFKDSKMKSNTLSEAFKRNKSVQNPQKATKVFRQLITNCTNKSLKLTCRCKTNGKRNKPWYIETWANLKNQFK